MTFEPGKLYKINKWFWLLFPTKETGARVGRPAAEDDVSYDDDVKAASWSSWWSKRLNCNVSFLNEGDVLMIVEVAGELVKVINQKAVPGWLIFPAAEKWTKDTIIEISDEP